MHFVYGSVFVLQLLFTVLMHMVCRFAQLFGFRTAGSINHVDWILCWPATLLGFLALLNACCFQVFIATGPWLLMV